MKQLFLDVSMCSTQCLYYSVETTQSALNSTHYGTKACEFHHWPPLMRGPTTAHDRSYHESRLSLFCEKEPAVCDESNWNIRSTKYWRKGDVRCDSAM